MCQSNENQLLAECPSLGGVSVCDCGTVHLSVGGMTLRLAPEAFSQMVSMCNDAVEQLTVRTQMMPLASRLAN